MSVMAHHLGEDQPIQALLGAGWTMSVALVRRALGSGG
jgi:hypothetical protein